jgi:hypothetical protein
MDLTDSGDNSESDIEDIEFGPLPDEMPDDCIGLGMLLTYGVYKSMNYRHQITKMF